MHVIAKDAVETPLLAPLGELIYELIGATQETGGARLHSLAHVVIPPGKLSPKHYHKASEETYVMLRGEAQMEIDDRPLTLAAGQCLLILPGEVHQIRNASGADVELLVICAPPWVPTDTYVVADVNTPISPHSPLAHQP